MVHLAGGTEESNAQLRAEFRTAIANPDAATLACGVQGLSDAQAAIYLDKLGGVFAAIATPKPTPEPTIDPQLLVRVIHIMQDERRQMGHQSR